MKTSIVLILSIIFALSNCFNNQSKKTISVSGAWALYPLMIKWAEEYQKVYPDITINISAGGAGKGMSDVLSQAVDIGMISREIFEIEIKKGAYSIPVAIDAVFPVINKKNPVYKMIRLNGITIEELKELWTKKNFGCLAEINKRFPSNIQYRIYTRSDACGAAKTWASLFKKKQEDLIGIGIYGDPGLLEAVKKDSIGFGYNNLNYIYDLDTGFPYEGIGVCPIDFNSDGKIDSIEYFYDNRTDVVEGIKNGKYPSPPSRVLYLVTNKEYHKKETYDFISWILKDGQKYIEETGYIMLSENLLRNAIRDIEKSYELL